MRVSVSQVVLLVVATWGVWDAFHVTQETEAFIFWKPPAVCLFGHAVNWCSLFEIFFNICTTENPCGGGSYSSYTSSSSSHYSSETISAPAQPPYYAPPRPRPRPRPRPIYIPPSPPPPPPPTPPPAPAVLPGGNIDDSEEYDDGDGSDAECSGQNCEASSPFAQFLRNFFNAPANMYTFFGGGGVGGGGAGGGGCQGAGC